MKTRQNKKDFKKEIIKDNKRINEIYDKKTGSGEDALKNALTENIINYPYISYKYRQNDLRELISLIRKEGASRKKPYEAQSYSAGFKEGKTQALKDFIDLLERRIEELNSLYKNDKENEKIVKIVTNELHKIIKSQLSNKKVGEE